MRCRKCNKYSRFPVCADCADEEELDVIKSLYAIDETIQIDRDRKKALFVYVMPLTRPMIVAILIFALGCVLSATKIYSPIYLNMIVFSAVLFIFSWMIHPPLKTEAVEDYRDMTNRIVSLKERKEVMIEILEEPSSAWTDAEKRYMKQNIFTGTGDN
ncbi:MAG: hypothetical protein R2883_02125 [Caldisericia bacterium]